MISVFNRRELIITYDMARQAEVRDLLAQNGIRYSVKVVNRKSPSPFAAGSRARTGTFGENLQFEREYTLYVHKSDYERAAAFVKKPR